MNKQERLREYINKDYIYINYKNGVEEGSDFDKFCIQHCKDIEELLEENEKLHHYKTLYQSLKRQKEELRSWLVEQEERAWDEVSSTFGYVLDKLEELEGVSNE